MGTPEGEWCFLKNQGILFDEEGGEWSFLVFSVRVIAQGDENRGVFVFLA